MKKILFLLAAILACQVARAQISVPSQEVHYNVNYHWGFVDVNIAKGVVTLQTDGNSFTGTLDGTSIPWEGRIICVSDTLKGSFSGSGNNLKETVTYQAGWYRRPPVSVFKSSTYNPEDPQYFKNTAGGGTYDASDDTMEAITVTADMIGMYYLSAALDFSSMQPGQKVTVPISGPYSKQVVITYMGPGTYVADGSTYRTYNCAFEYSYGGKMSGFPVDCYIGVDNKVPLFLSASLPVGKVEMIYTEN